jgi:hypothetical protein
MEQGNEKILFTDPFDAAGILPWGSISNFLNYSFALK